MKRLRPSQRGFACVMVLVVGSMLFLLMAAVTNTFYAVHATNQARLADLQERCGQMTIELAKE